MTNQKTPEQDSAQTERRSRVARARQIASRAAAYDGSDPVSDQAFLAVVNGERDLYVAANDQAFGIVGQGELDLVVAPEHRGQGIGSTMLNTLLSHARTDRRNASDESASKTTAEPLRAWVHGDNPAASALLEAKGFAPVRTLYRMTLPPSELPSPSLKRSNDEVVRADPPSKPLPAGLKLRSFRNDHPADAAAWVRVNAAAFHDHPEQGRITLEDFRQLRDESWFDAEDLLVLEVGDSDPLEFAGSTWIKTIRAAHDAQSEPSVETELYAIGVDPTWAGYGLGRLLLNATLTRMAEHRPTEVSLYVDGENTRAIKMYEQSGFSIQKTSRQWLLEPAKMDA